MRKRMTVLVRHLPEPLAKRLFTRFELLDVGLQVLIHTLDARERPLAGQRRLRPVVDMEPSPLRERSTCPSATAEPRWRSVNEYEPPMSAGDTINKSYRTSLRKGGGRILPDTPSDYRCD